MVLQILKQNAGLGKMQDQFYPRNQTKRDDSCDTKTQYMLFYFVSEKNIKEVRNGIKV